VTGDEDEVVDELLKALDLLDCRVDLAVLLNPALEELGGLTLAAMERWCYSAD
jgi:hypothetical protein